jgi:hypothetical protein
MSEGKEMSQATDRFAAAVEEFARQVERMRAPLPEFMSEEDADKFGNEAVHETRRKSLDNGSFLNELITEEEAREWVRRREERRRREGYRPI